MTQNTIEYVRKFITRFSVLHLIISHTKQNAIQFNFKLKIDFF